VISDNTILNISQAFDSAGAIFAVAFKGLSITGNTIEQCGSATRDGGGIIVFTGGDPAVSGVAYGEGGTISNNTVIRGRKFGIELVGVRNMTVTGNSILSTGWNIGAGDAFAIMLWRITIDSVNYGCERNIIANNVVGLLEQDSTVSCSTALRVEHIDSQYHTFVGNKVDPVSCTSVFVDNGGSDTNMNAGTRSTESTDLTWYCDSLGIKSQTAQAFTLDIQNNGGTLQVRIGRPYFDGSLSGDFNAKIISASTTATNLPTVNASTDFGSVGAGIYDGTTNALVLNTTAQTSTDFVAMSSVSFNDSGTAITVAVSAAQRDVNGSSITRPELRLYNATTGAAFGINTTNIPTGDKISFTIMGYVA